MGSTGQSAGNGPKPRRQTVKIEVMEHLYCSISVYASPRAVALLTALGAAAVGGGAWSWIR